MTCSGRSILLTAGLACLAGPLGASSRDGFSLAVLVDGRPVEEYAARDRIYVEALKGRDFVLRLTNPTDSRIAVALSVDGRNVIDAKRTGAREASKWVLSPGETLDVPGWQVSGKTARRFFFTTTSDSYAKWLGDTANVGTIEAVFYREKRREPVFVPKDEAQFAPRTEESVRVRENAAGSAESVPVPPSSPAPSSPSTSAPSSARQKAAPKSAADAFAATGIGDKTDNPVQWVAFDLDPSPVVRLALRYEFRTELVRLGVLPREADLYARDRAHGFEHEYAPDPYRR